VILSLLFVGMAAPIIRLCGSSDVTPEDLATHQAAVVYFRIIMGGMIFNCIQMAVNSAQRGAGNTKITMRTNVTSNVVNIILNYLLIEGHFGFPALGIVGAALATVLGTVVSCVMSILSITKKTSFISIPYVLGNRLKASFAAFQSLVRIGYGIFFEQILMRIGFMATAVMAAKMGMDAMAAHQVGMNLMGLTFSFGDGLQAAAVALIGRSLGQGKPELAKEYGRTCKAVGIMIAVALTLLYFFGARWLMSMFFREEHIITIGVSIMRVIIFVVIFQIIQVIYMGCLRGAGDTLYTAFAATMSVTVMRTLVSWLGGFVFGLGIVGIWLGVLADQISRFTFASIRYRMGKWVKIKI
ncbi:MAG: MATE family efflux transporter, partial [Lachnospiraceae bacterium]|nr:MATE family efflux transporter [Lachnospiraceae bacterium]